MSDIWTDGMVGLIVGDALGVPVQFLTREEIRRRPQGPVTGMEGHGTYNMPAGSWSDDSSMALAVLASIRETGTVDPDDMMEHFEKWEVDGAYTPYGFAYDQGGTCMTAIYRYLEDRDWKTCGKTGDHANGNGALMRILPVCLYYAERQNQVCTSDDEAIEGIHTATMITHNHLRAKIASGLYYFMVKSILKGNFLTNSTAGEKIGEEIGAENPDSLITLLQEGLEEGFAYYRRDFRNREETEKFSRLYHLEKFRDTPEEEIKSSGYVLDSIEAAVWCLINTDSYADCVLKAVNLGLDTDTTAAIAGGLACLYYGKASIPEEWLQTVREGKILPTDLVEI